MYKYKHWKGWCILKDARERRYEKEARERAKAYLVIKRGYVGAQEKKAFKIAERLRRRDWVDSLAALPEDERSARLRAFAVFKRAVFWRGLLPAKRKKARKEQPQPDSAQ